MSTVDRLKELKDKAKHKIAAAVEQQQTVEREKSLRPVYGRTINPSLLAGQPHVTTGPIYKDSAGYSMLRAAAFCDRAIGVDECKEEQEVSRRLKSYYGHVQDKSNSLLVVASANPMYHGVQVREDSNGQAFLKELGQKMRAGVEKADPDEARYYAEKSLGTFPATAGGTFIPPPTLLTDIIEFQRNREVFARAGATEMTFGPNGAVSIPRQTGASTAYWVGEGQTITDSELTTGQLELRAKKLAVLTSLTVEGMNFSNPSLENLARRDMAMTAALKADQSMLEGTGSSVAVKGLITYVGDSNTYLNINVMVASTTGTDGDTFTPEDVARLWGTMPDAVNDKDLKFIMRPDFFTVIRNRRAAGSAAGNGLFMFNTMSQGPDSFPLQLNGYEVIASRQASNNRAKGSATNLNYVVFGHMPDWMIARYGVMELQMNPYGQTDFANGTVRLRALQFMDAGPRTPNSFTLCDDLMLS
jgi:HK97 family phage major capsid protein